MTLPVHSAFTAGVVEGFYGPPWSEPERMQLLGWMRGWGLNAYMYAPKDDLKHRVLWREWYDEKELQRLVTLCQACDQRGIAFIYGISPGLSMRHSSESDQQLLVKKLHQILEIGCRQFALLFDDIPDRLDPQDQARWGSIAAAQAHTANHVLAELRARALETKLWFCPTPYCKRMARRALGGAGYLEVLGKELDPEVPVFWTGPEIVSENIPMEHVEWVNHLLNRKIALWDNLLANDYDGRRFFSGPYSGRPLDLKSVAQGIFVNPNTEFLLNYTGLRSFASWVGASGAWEARQSYLKAVEEWLPEFEVVGGRVGLQELIAFLDCYYLPHQDGTECERFYGNYAELVSFPISRWDERAYQARAAAEGLQRTCAILAQLANRPLFHALSRRIWELREELDLVIKFLDAGLASDGSRECFSDFHLPGTYLGGLTARLQRLICQRADGVFVPADCCRGTGMQ